MITPTMKRKLREAYHKVAPQPQTPDTAEQAAIRVIASLDTKDVLDLARPASADRLKGLIQEITQ